MANDKTEKAPAQPAPQPPGAPPDAAAPGAQLAELRARLEAKDAELAKAKVEQAQLEERLTQARAENAALKGKLDKSGQSSLPDLGKGSFELLESVTIADRAGQRISPRRGDVVSVVKDTEAVAAKVAGRARVYPVAEKTLDELLELSAIRV